MQLDLSLTCKHVAVLTRQGLSAISMRNSNPHRSYERHTELDIASHADDENPPDKRLVASTSQRHMEPPTCLTPHPYLWYMGTLFQCMKDQTSVIQFVLGKQYEHYEI